MTNLEFYGKGYMDKEEFFRLIEIYAEERRSNNQESEIIDNRTFLSDFINWLHSKHY